MRLEIGTSAQPIPVHFSFAEDDHIEGSLSPERRLLLRDRFDLPDLAAMDDGIANGTHEPGPGEAHPLALFTAPRVDYSLHRLRHYSGTRPEHFQNFVLFTNYQFYIDEFIRLGHECMQDPRGAYTAFVEPGDVTTHRSGLPAPPAARPGGRRRGCRRCRLPPRARPDGAGLTMVNIGVGPANAKTITDHIAVLRPHAWIMLGHCAGLRNTQQLGDYVLAHGYVREDHVLDEDLPPGFRSRAGRGAGGARIGRWPRSRNCRGYELKRVMRTGTVASTDNRNWELLPHRGPERRFSQSRAIALDMESATIAANGFRFRVPYGTLLCVSDKPLHGEIKLPGMANEFYRERVDQHLRIGMRAAELLRAGLIDQLHSRKLRSFAEGGVPVAVSRTRQRPAATTAEHAGRAKGGQGQAWRCGGGRRMRYRPVRPRTERRCRAPEPA